MPWAQAKPSFRPLLVCHRDACRRPGPNCTLQQSGCHGGTDHRPSGQRCRTARHAQKSLYLQPRRAIWKEVSRKYLQVFSEVRQNRTRNPRPRHSYVENIKAITNFELPEIKLDHLKAFTDDTGILQHANYTIPDRTHGYCTDDNARALLVAAMGQKYLPTNGWGLISQRSLSRISSVCL
jgi:hypothetical protein